MSTLTGRPNPATIHAAADALAAGETTSAALCEQLIGRKNDVDGEVQSYLSLNEQDVLEAARAADEKRAGGDAGRFEGIPIAIKDNIAVAGERNSCASKLLDPFTSTFDATVIERLKAAGFIPMGRMNMDEFAMGSSTEHSAFQLTRNPWDTDCVPGGSSGGSAAAIASGSALAALGSDTGGSIRQPANFCGVVGLKPTYGRVSRYGLVAFASSLDQIGPLTGDVRDAAILLDTIGGSDPRDCTSLPQDCGGFEAALEDTEISKLRVGMPQEFFEVEGLNDEVRQTVEATRDRLAAAGATIVDVALPNLKYGVASYYVIATAEASSNLSRFEGVRYGARAQDAESLADIYYKTREQGFGAEVKRRIILGTYVLSSGYYDAYYLRAQKVRTLMRRDFEQAFEQCDVILSPGAPGPAFRLGEISDPLEMYLSDIYTIPVNLAGNCGISVPVGSSSAGLPIGVQVIGDALNENAILQTAHWLEQEGDDA